MTKRSQPRDSDAALARDVSRLVDKVKLLTERAQRRTQEPDCTVAERKKIRAELQRLLDALDGAMGKKEDKTSE